MVVEAFMAAEGMLAGATGNWLLRRTKFKEVEMDL